MLKDKRILITGGAGFIGTTLASRLVDANEIVAVDNLHRDVLGGTDLVAHPNFELHEVDVLDGERVRELAQGATHIVHCAAIAGVDTVRESPVRTMRVNMIGTYNVLEAALATADTLERLVEFSTSEVFGTHAINAREGQVTTIDCRGATLMPGLTDAHVHICAVEGNITDQHRYLPPSLLAARASAALELAHNAPEAAEAARDKHLMRTLFARAAVPSSVASLTRSVR